MAVALTTDVNDVTNSLQAFEHVRHKLHTSHDDLPIWTHLLCQAHEILMDNVRGDQKMAGEIRRSQNWIGGTRPGNAVHVPPPHTELDALLGQLENYIHQRPVPALPPLVRIALIHAQFETIHPFLDGNGRIGRLLIAADRKKVMAAKEATVQSIRLFEMLPTMPRFTTTFATDKLGVTFPTASTAIKVLQGVGILECHHLDH